VALATGIPAAIAANSLDGVRALAGSAGARESDGLTMLAILAALCVLAAGAVWFTARGEWHAPPLPRWVKIATVVAVVALAGFGGALAARDKGHPPATGANASRLGSLETHRFKYWKVGLEHGFASHPIEGVGAGGFGVIWLQYRDVRERVKVAHSLYVGTLAELGIVGFALLALFLGGVAAAATRARVPGAIAAFVVWATHTALDWDWEMPALTLVAIALAGLIVASAEEAPAPA
jgi:O-antigen ligase